VLRISVHDDGPGIPGEFRARIFEKFSQADASATREKGGTGLGLHIVYSIVTTRLGGRLDLDSQPGGGTRIQMILPRTAPLEQAAE
jgi:signal transduction histidine kinase